jgi:hypothetical protein
MREALFWSGLLVVYVLEWGTFAVNGIVSSKDFLLSCIDAIEFWSGLPFIFLGWLVTGEDHLIFKLVAFAAHGILSFRSFFIGPNSAHTIYTVSREDVTAFCLVILWCLFNERIEFWKDLPYIFLGCLFTGETCCSIDHICFTYIVFIENFHGWTKICTYHILGTCFLDSQCCLRSHLLAVKPKN